MLKGMLVQCEGIVLDGPMLLHSTNYYLLLQTDNQIKYKNDNCL